MAEKDLKDIAYATPKRVFRWIPHVFQPSYPDVSSPRVDFQSTYKCCEQEWVSDDSELLKILTFVQDRHDIVGGTTWKQRFPHDKLGDLHVLGS